MANADDISQSASALTKKLNDVSYLDVLSGATSATVLADPIKPDMPLFFVNDAFLELTGYSREEVIGRNCRFLQGDDTDQFELDRLRKAIRSETSCVVELMNYRKDGSQFWNSLHLSPIKDSDGKLVCFKAVQTDVTDVVAPRDEGKMRNALAREMHHRVKNLLAVASSIVRLSARGATDAEDLSKKATHRIEALSRAHAATFAPSGHEHEMADLGAVAKAMLRPFEQEFPKAVIAHGDEVQLPIQAITPVALALHELGANAREHGCLKQDHGSIDVKWTVEGENLVIRWSETCAEPIEPPEVLEHGFGMRAAEMLLQSVNGTIEHDWKAHGLNASIAIPRKQPSRY